MAMEIPGIVPPRNHPEFTSLEKLPVKPGNRGRTRETVPLDKDIKETLRNLEKIISQFNRRFKISLDENINRIVVKVIDAETDKIIKEIPPEEIQHLLANLKEMMGLLVDERI